MIQFTCNPFLATSPSNGPLESNALFKSQSTRGLQHPIKHPPVQKPNNPPTLQPSISSTTRERSSFNFWPWVLIAAGISFLAFGVWKVIQESLVKEDEGQSGSDGEDSAEQE